MSAAKFRFYAELNDFLPNESRGKELAGRFDVSGSVKDFIESFGVPHTEVDLVLANGNPVDFSYLVGDGDLLSVYPVFESLDISSVTRVRAAPLRALGFLLDAHLGRLAAYLRMAGFDALYDNRAPDAELADIAAREGRVLLTRDRYLLMRTEVDRGYRVRSTEPKKQLLEIIHRFDLAGSMRPFTRCLKCNSTLEEASRESVSRRLPPRIKEDIFNVCLTCRRVYWKRLPSCENDQAAGVGKGKGSRLIVPKEEHSTSSCSPFLSRRFYLALDLAAGLHHGQCRKGTNIPYIAHLMSVCATVLENGATRIWPSQPFSTMRSKTREEGRLWKPYATCSVIGWQGSIVECSDTDQVPKPPWRERKEAYVAHLRIASADARLVSAADKLSNLRNILADYRQLGENLWGRFNAQREDQLWFYRCVISALRGAGSNPIVDEMDNVVHQLEELIADELRDK